MKGLIAQRLGLLAWAVAAIVCLGWGVPAWAGGDDERCLFENALHRAVARGDVAHVRSLLGARPALRGEANALGETPLHVAARAGHLGALGVLLGGVGAELERPDARGATPLLAAVWAGQDALARRLVAAGANIDAAAEGRGVLHAAARRGMVGFSLSVLSALARGQPAAERSATFARALAATDADGLTPLDHAVLAGAQPLVRAFMARGALVGPETIALACGLSRVALARTLAHSAGDPPAIARALEVVMATTGPLEVGTVSCLLDAGAAATTAAFRRALELRREDLAAALLVRATAHAHEGDTMLHAAASAGASELVEVLRLIGVPIDARDAAGATALHRAIAAGQEATVRQLLAAGADAAATWAGVSARDLALRSGRPGLLRAVVDAAGYDALAAAALDEVEVLGRLLADDPEAATRVGSDGLAPIHVAGRFGARAAIELLVARGVPVDLAGQDGPHHGWTALHFAAAHGHARLFRWLRERGAKDEAAMDGRTASERAAFPLSELITDADVWELWREHASASPDDAATPPPMERPRTPVTEGMGPEGEGVGGAPSFIALGGGVFREERRLEEEVIPERSLVDGRGDWSTEVWSSALGGCVLRGHWAEAERVARWLAAEQGLAPLPRERGGPGWDGRRLTRAATGQSLARVLIERGRLDEAARALSDAGRVLASLAPRQVADTFEQLTPLVRVRAALQLAMARLEARRGRADSAVAALEASLTWLQGDARRALRASVLGQLAVILGEAARYDEAIAHARRALEDATQADAAIAPSLHVLRHNLATLLGRAGARDEARGWVLAELVRVEAGEVTGVEDRAMIRYAAGLWRGVDGALDDAYALMAKARDELAAGFPGHPALGRLDLGLGHSSIALGQLERAEEVLVRGERALLTSEGPIELEALSRSAAVDIARVRAARAAVARRQGRAAEALELARDAYAIVVGGEVPEARWSIELELARCEAASGHLAGAIFFGKRATRTLARIREEHVAPELRRAFVEDRLEAWRELADHLAQAGRFLEATAALGALKEDEAEAMTVRGQRDDDAATKGAVPDVGAERRGDLAERPVVEAQRTLNELTKSGVAHEPGPTDLARLERARRLLRERRRAFEAWLQALEGELGAMSPERARAIAAMNLRDIAALQGTLGELGPGVVLLHYLVTEDRLRIIVTTKAGQVGREVPIALRDLNGLVFQFRQVLADGRRSPEAAAVALYQVLIAPIEADLAEHEAQTLLVSLDGALRYVPLTALWDGRQWLVERYRIVHFARAALDKIMVGRRGDDSLAAFGCGREVPGFVKLDAVPLELEGIVKRDADDPDGELPGVVVLDDAFSRDALTRLLEERRYRAVHIASHFVLDPGSEADSYLLLGDGSRLTLEDIRYDLRFDDVDLLALSACNTAMGESAADGRELEGFASLALRLGARAVLATLWPVNDASTGLFMRTLYRLLREDPKRSRADALRLAMLAFIRGEVSPHVDDVAHTGRARPLAVTTPTSAAPAAAATDPGVALDLKHPRYWAPFVFIGNWR